MTRGGWGEGTLTELGGGKWKLRMPPYLGRGQVTFRAANKTAARKEQRRLLDEAYADRFGPQATSMPTFDEHCDWVLDHHQTGDANTLSKLRSALSWAREAFGDELLCDITFDDIERERRNLVKRNLAPSTVHYYVQSVRQVFNQAVNRKILVEAPTRHIKNPVPKAAPVFPFESVDEVLKVAAEMEPGWRLLPILACGTGMRPEELLAVERADIHDGKIVVSKRWVRGEFKAGTKNGEAERMVPLHAWVAEALAAHPVRIDSRLLLPGADGGHAKLDWVRTQVWQPAMEASGVRRRRLKDCRHTFATWQLTGNCNIWHLSKVMGTAVEQLERTYGRWIPGSEQVVLSAMDAFFAKPEEVAAK